MKIKKKTKGITWEETVCKDFGIAIPKRVSDLISMKTSNILKILIRVKIKFFAHFSKIEFLI